MTKRYMKHARINFKYLKRKASDRKGLGMELALLVLLVVFACSTLLVTSALIGKGNIQQKELELTTRIALDRMAEEYIAANPDDLEFTVEDENGNTLTVSHSGGIITEWKYN